MVAKAGCPRVGGRCEAEGEGFQEGSQWGPQKIFETDVCANVRPKSWGV